MVPRDAPDATTAVYRYLMVVDRSPSDLGASNLFCGTDIDAVILGHAGTAMPATGALASAGGACLEGPVRTGLATGSPQSTCEMGTFASLGGEGGYLVLSFSQPIEPGDSIQVHECTVSGIMDHYDLRVGTSTDPTAPSWVTIAEGLTDVTEVIVPALP